MLTPDLLRNKLGFVQLKIKKTWKLYWRGNLILDGGALLGNGFKIVPMLREYPCAIRCLSEETKIFDNRVVLVRIDYFPEDGFLVYISGDDLIETMKAESNSILHQLKNCLSFRFLDMNRLKAA